MRIGELAERVGTSTRTLRYYEQRGLLRSRRTSSGYRDYDEDDARLVREIRTLLGIGFGLEETRPFVECLRAGHDAGDACPASLEVYRRKLGELEECIDRMQGLHSRLAGLLDRAERERHGARPADPANLAGLLPPPPEPRCALGAAPATPPGASAGNRLED